MSVPSVTFPIEQEQVKATFEMLRKHLLGLQADTKVTQELMKVLRTFCSHPHKTKFNCSDCGESWDYD